MLMRWKVLSIMAIVMSVFSVVYMMISLNNRNENVSFSLDQADMKVVSQTDITSVDVEHFNDMINEMDTEIIMQNAKLKAMEEKLNSLNDANKDLAMNIDTLEEKLTMYESLDIKENLYMHWNLMWRSFDGYGGELSEVHIEHINKLLQTTFRYYSTAEINPISCFFTSFYDDVKELNFDRFMSHFPAGVIPQELPEFDLLRNDENWYFGSDIELASMPVPIHRYSRIEVLEVLEMYAGIDTEELVGDSKLIYLESTNSYYNFTSDYGPGQFTCTGGEVNNGVIKLYRDVEGAERIVLTIVNENGKYMIKSFNIE